MNKELKSILIESVTLLDRAHRLANDHLLNADADSQFYGEDASFWELKNKIINYMNQPKTIKYVIKFTDGFYNTGLGHPCDLPEATRFANKKDAEDFALELCDVSCIEEIYE